MIFLSDNGANEVRCGWREPRRPDTRNSQAKQGGEWANVSNTPFRRYKRHMHNGGVYSPLIVRWAGSDLKRGTILHEPIHLVDLYPTIVEQTGAKYPKGEQWSVAPEKGLKASWEIAPLSGVSVVDLIESGENPNRDYIVGHFQGARMMRSGDWKLVSDGGDGTVQHLYDFEWELYNMRTDPSECNDVASQYPEMIDSLDLKYRAWIARAEQMSGLTDSNNTNHKWYVQRMTLEHMNIKEESDKKPESSLNEKTGWNCR